MENTENKLMQYAKHLASCNINRDDLFDEARQALADTPEKFRDEGYHQACIELELKSMKCTCGLNQALAYYSEPSEQKPSEGTEEEFKNQLKVLFKLNPEDIQALDKIILEAKKQARNEAIQECIDALHRFNCIPINYISPNAIKELEKLKK